jgi:beta-N-acetylhexosaminidase
MICAGFTGTSVPRDMVDLIRRGIGGAVLFKRNFANAQQLADLCAELKRIADRPFLICIDHEGGRVTRLGPPFTRIPPMRAVGRSTPQAARKIGQLMARELRAANIDMNLAPVLDVDSNPANPVIANRSFGRTPDLVATMGCAMIGGLQGGGVAACGKHFPGHGDTSQDSHKDLPRLGHDLTRLKEVEIPPFVAAIKAGVAAIMTAHIRFVDIDPAFPATMSAPVLRILREDLRFKGVIVSDDLEMNAVVGDYGLEEVMSRCSSAGVDLFMFAHSAAKQNQAIDILTRDAERRLLPREVVRGAGKRLDRLFARFVRPARKVKLSAILGCPKHQAIVASFSTSRSGADPTHYRAAIKQ